MAKQARLSHQETLGLYGKEVSSEDRLRDIENLLDALSVASLPDTF
jgi:hypothetical protein